MSTMTTIQDGTYRYLGFNEFEEVSKESAGYWVSSTNIQPGSDATVELAMTTLVAEYGAKFVGIWTDDNGNRYVDKSHYVRDREVAEAAAKQWKQDAIWDIANNEAIYI
jgi:hypothetical protein